MLPKGTFIALAVGLVTLAIGYGLSYLLNTNFREPPVLLELPVTAITAFGAVVFALGIYAIIVGVSDARKKHSRKD